MARAEILRQMRCPVCSCAIDLFGFSGRRGTDAIEQGDTIVIFPQPALDCGNQRSQWRQKCPQHDGRGAADGKRADVWPYLRILERSSDVDRRPDRGDVDVLGFGLEQVV